MKAMGNAEAGDLTQVIESIARTADRLECFWSNAAGWAPGKAAEVLSRSRLDRQASLARCLELWASDYPDELTDGVLVLGWAHLGSLVEGALMLFFSVWRNDYAKDPKARRDMKNTLVEPDELLLEHLCQALERHGLLTQWQPWIRHIQQRRNAIHSFRDRDIGSLQELRSDVRRYLDFLTGIEGSLPYPLE
jgi:hypothetical protein